MYSALVPHTRVADPLWIVSGSDLREKPTPDSTLEKQPGSGSDPILKTGSGSDHTLETGSVSDLIPKNRIRIRPNHRDPYPQPCLIPFFTNSLPPLPSLHINPPSPSDVP